MEDLSPELTQLEERLAALPESREAMLLSELDGYLAGVLVCPEPIPQGEWLSPIWRGDVDGAEPPFDDSRDLRAFSDLVSRRFDAIGEELRQGGGQYRPVFDVDEDDDEEVVWETWIAGFEQAMSLRPDSWLAILQGEDDEAANALAVFIALGAIADGADSDDLDGVKVEDLAREAPDVIPLCLEVLNGWRLTHGGGVPANTP